MPSLLERLPFFKSERYKFVEGYAHFITFAVVGWVDVFTRREYAEYLLENLRTAARTRD